MASEFKLNADGSVTRARDSLVIQNDMLNRDWKDYQEFLNGGGVPDPVDPPAPPPEGGEGEGGATATKRK